MYDLNMSLKESEKSTYAVLGKVGAKFNDRKIQPSNMLNMKPDNFAYKTTYTQNKVLGNIKPLYPGIKIP